MSIVYNLVVVFHFLGLASLIGGWLVQMGARGERYVSPAMLHGVLTLLLTGVILVGLAEGVESLERDIDNAKIAVKLGVALVVAVLAWFNRRRQAIPDGLYFVIGGLAIANVVVAVFWR
ncbi:MAG TPA: hypothetical protein VFR23_22650 [Jiangellaceae bacterium]|nr:hypothetical protein [Jiangellaceae bacterium]